MIFHANEWLPEEWHHDKNVTTHIKFEFPYCNTELLGFHNNDVQFADAVVFFIKLTRQKTSICERVCVHFD